MIPTPTYNTTVTIATPGAPRIDPESGSERPGAPIVQTSRAYLSQKPLGQIGREVENLAKQHTVTSRYTLLLPPATHITSQSTVTSRKRSYDVEGEPAERTSLLLGRVVYQAATLRFVSDIQQHKQRLAGV